MHIYFCSVLWWLHQHVYSSKQADCSSRLLLGFWLFNSWFWFDWFVKQVVFFIVVKQRWCRRFLQNISTMLSLFLCVHYIVKMKVHLYSTTSKPGLYAFDASFLVLINFALFFKYIFTIEANCFHTISSSR